MTTARPADLHFVDTNVWLYALIRGQNATKAQRARTLITQGTSIVVSTQVINEICVNLIKRENFTAMQTRDLINDFYAAYTVIELDQSILVLATSLREQYTLSYWDSLIVASALSSGASILHSEDMHDQLIVDQRLTIVNPFK
jgi:predicted nucleic acid-binding protein